MDFLLIKFLKDFFVVISVLNSIVNVISIVKNILLKRVSLYLLVLGLG